MKTVLNLKSKGKKNKHTKKKRTKEKTLKKQKNSFKSNFSYGIKHENRHGNKECISMYQSKICILKL